MEAPSPSSSLMPPLHPGNTVISSERYELEGGLHIICLLPAWSPVAEFRWETGDMDTQLP